jgi:tetratricopeptide (TPR) repeat protein
VERGGKRDYPVEIVGGITRRKHLFAAPLFALAVFFAAVPASGLSLDEGIAQIARDIEAGLPAGTRIAAVNFESPSARFSDYVLEELQGVFVNNKRLVVTERSEQELVRDELAFQMSGEVSDESAASLGKFIGAQALITGSLTDIGGGNYRFRFNAIDVETAVRKLSLAVTIQRDTTIAFMLPADAAPPPARVPARPDPALATVYFNAGFAYYEAKRYTEAVADFTRVLEVKSDDIAALRYRAYSYYDLKDYDRSIEDASRLIQLEPRNVRNYLLRSVAYNEKGEYDKMIADCDQLLRFDPNSAEAYNNRGLAYDGKGEHDRAIADFNQALRLNPNYAEAYNNRGTAYNNKGEYDRAIADFNQALRLNPNYTEAYHNRGNAYVNKGEHDRAIADYNQALRLNPNLAEAYKGRDLAYYYKGEYDRAIADFNEALRLDPNDVVAYNNRGTVHVMKGDYARARADWEKALQIDPNSAGARNNLGVLQSEGH